MIDIKLLPPYESSFVVPFIQVLLKDYDAEVCPYVFNQENYVHIHVRAAIPKHVQDDLDFFIREIQNKYSD